MATRKFILSGLLGAALCLSITAGAFAQGKSGKSRIYNTVKTKLAEGKQVFGGTVSSPDEEAYCAMANSGFDFLWIEMQHSSLTYSEVANMIRACPGSDAIPFIRVPDATEGDIQKATDIGALGIILPMVDDVKKVHDAIKFAHFPPLGRRSQGGGQYRQLWGDDYRATANDNIMIVAMIENREGVAIADKIAAIPEVDVVFAASTDLSSFSGWKQGEPKYEAMVKEIHDKVLKAGKVLAGPMAWRDRDGYKFFQSPGTSAVIRAGAKAMLSGQASEGPRRGVAAIEGSEPKK